jgi:uncharacterized integral membrane protein (TIGR00697 family)
MLSTLQNKKSDSYYLFFTALFSVVLVLTNIIGAKLFEGPFNPAQHALTTGILTYPITFLLTDVVSEIWGAKKANMMVYIGFMMSFIMLAIVQLALYVPAHPFWVAPDNPFGYTSTEQYQNAYASVFSVNGKLLFGSMLAFVVAQLLDVRLFHFFRRLTGGKYLWLRNNCSTWISQLADTFIVNSILFYWAFGWDFYTGIQVMITIYFYKMFIALLDTPLIYLAVFSLRKSLGLKSNETLVEAA